MQDYLKGCLRLNHLQPGLTTLLYLTGKRVMTGMRIILSPIGILAVLQPLLPNNG